LKIEFSTAESTDLGVQPVAPKKHGWLPVLVVLFLISYGLMTMLIVEQGRTIENQRTLIHELFKDASELSAAKTKASEQHIADQSSAQQNLTAQIPSPSIQANRNPSKHSPSTQAQTKQAPSSQVGVQQDVQNQVARPKTRVPVPTRPASEVADSGRSLITI
jgi:cytoskeletal protein RodZ